MAESFSMDARVQPKDNLDTRSDLDLIAAINRGDSGAFEVLYFPLP